MDSNTSVAIMFISAFSSTALIINFLLNYRFKSRLFRSGMLDEEASKLIKQLNADSRRKVLKWSLLLSFGGLGLITLQFTTYGLNDPLPYGLEAIFISAGLLIYYSLTSKKNVA